MRHKNWTSELILQEALKYKTRTEWINKSRYTYNLAKKLGILSAAHINMKNAWETKWDKESVLLDARKYLTKNEWRKSSHSAYKAAKRLNCISEACAHMSTLRKRWDDFEIIVEAKRFKNRKEWQANSPSYCTAARRGLLDKVCGHMINPGGVSLMELEVMNFIRETFKSAHRKRFSTKGSSRALVTRCFELDIFIPELSKGVEFDGKYWHGEGLKREWTQNHEEYLSVKDSFFLEKGIKVIHVKEEDWRSCPLGVKTNLMKFLTQLT